MRDPVYDIAEKALEEDKERMDHNYMKLYTPQEKDAYYQGYLKAHYDALRAKK